MCVFLCIHAVHRTGGLVVCVFSCIHTVHRTGGFGVYLDFFACYYLVAILETSFGD